jgi:hypothetical protein
VFGDIRPATNMVEVPGINDPDPPVELGATAFVGEDA